MLFIRTYSEHRYVATISNRIYNYPTQITKKKDKATNSNKTTKDLNTKDNLHSCLKTSKESSIEKVLVKIKEYLSYDRKLIINFCEMMKTLIEIFFCPKKYRSEKTILLENAKKKLHEDIDLFNILRSENDLERIKSLLFSDKQLIILNYCPKPDIINELSKTNDFPTVNLLMESTFKKPTGHNRKKTLKRLAKKTKTYLMTTSNKNIYEDINDFREMIIAWKELKKDCNLSEINKKLIFMIGTHFSETFDLDDSTLKNFGLDKENDNLKNSHSEKLIPQKSKLFNEEFETGTLVEDNINEVRKMKSCKLLKET